MAEEKKTKPAGGAAKSTGKSGEAKKGYGNKANNKFGKANGNKANNKSGKANKKPWENQPAKAASKKPVKEFKSFLYLLPKKTGAKDLAKVLTFLSKDAVEVWEDECVLEITTENGAITFEDIKDSLEKEDEKVLSSLRMKQVIACDYESTDAPLVQKIMEAFEKAFQGKIGSDTESFEPFLTREEL